MTTNNAVPICTSLRFCCSLLQEQQLDGAKKPLRQSILDRLETVIVQLKKSVRCRIPRYKMYEGLDITRVYDFVRGVLLRVQKFTRVNMSKVLARLKQLKGE